MDFFWVNAFLFCSSVSSSMPAIHSRHILRLSDCPTSFTLLILWLPLLLMVDASKLSAILYSASTSGNLMCGTSSKSAHESSGFNSLASDA